MSLECDNFVFKNVNWLLLLRRGVWVGFRLPTKLLLTVMKPNCRRSLSSSGIYNLDPYIDEKGLRVGGKLEKSSLHLNYVHSVLLRKDGNIPRLIVEWCHKKVVHGGSRLTINEIRSNGFWVVWCNTIAILRLQLSPL